MHGDECLVLVFHGSRLPLTQQTARSILEQLQRETPRLPMRLGFLAMGEPALDKVLGDAGRESFRRVKIWPLFTLPGRHTDTDIPEIVNSAAREFPDVQFALQPCLGSDPCFINWLQQRINDLSPPTTGDDGDA